MSDNQLVPYADVERIGKMLAASKLFGMKTAEEAIALCLIAQAEGKHPATAAQEYHVIQGRPALKADAMLARFQAAGGKVGWTSYTDTKVAGKFSHPQGGAVTIEWSIEMAKKLGYDKKDNWRNFPRAMMRARCISEGVRTVYPGIAVGIYTPEEVQDLDNKPDMVDITPPAGHTADGEVIDAPKPPNGNGTKPEYRPSDPVRPHKDQYVIPAPILNDGTLDFDGFACDLELALEGAKSTEELSLLNRSNAKTLKVMEKERPDLYGAIGGKYRQMSQSLM